jgi:hypothetical protein
VPEFVSGELNADGKRVVVIGGGDTAMDCVRTAVRQGATSVKCLYRRDRANMPGSQREVAERRGGGRRVRLALCAQGFTGDAVEGVMVQKMRLARRMRRGGRRRRLIEGADYVEDADLVIKALGFEPEDLPTLWNCPELEVTRWGTIKADFRTHETALPNVYAVGDIVRGASLVVWAIRDGREAAEAILEKVMARGCTGWPRNERVRALLATAILMTPAVARGGAGRPAPVPGARRVHAFLTVQSRSCLVSHHWTCEADPEGHPLARVAGSGRRVLPELFRCGVPLAPVVEPAGRRHRYADRTRTGSRQPDGAFRDGQRLDGVLDPRGNLSRAPSSGTTPGSTG